MMIRTLRSGFSIIELAAVLAIIAVVTGMVMTIGSAQQESSKVDITQERLNKIEDAITRFALRAGYVPCPATPGIALSDANFGLSETCSNAAPSAVPPAAQCIAEVNNGTNQEIWIGMVPTRTLSLPDEYALDAWGNRFTYASVRRMGARNTFYGYQASSTPYSVIDVRDGGNNAVVESKAINVVPFIVLSHGKDGLGAYPRNGGSISAACGVAGRKDEENCDRNDAIFVDTRINDTTNATTITNYFDDLVRWKVLSELVETPELSTTDTNDRESDARIAAGFQHSCGVRTTDAAACWGQDTSGQQGDDSTIPSAPTNTTADSVAGLTNVESIGAGTSHSCALKTTRVFGFDTGEVWCWGEDGSEQLGSGAGTTDQGTPVQVDTSTGLSNATQLSVGYDHACAVQKGGTAYCWGEGSAGQLGNNAVADSASPVIVLKSVAATDYLGASSPTVRQIAAGDTHTCAVMSDGTLYCWGTESVGELGDGAVSWTSNSNFAILIGGIANVVEASAGQDHTCAVTNAGALYCWGSDANGRLGTPGVNANAASPTLVAVGGVGTVSHVSVGLAHTCVVLTDGSAKCWGDDTSGRLGNAASGSQTDASAAPDVAGGLTWSYVSAGRLHSCGVTTGKVAYCWGEGTLFEIGNNLSGDLQSPTAVSSF